MAGVIETFRLTKRYDGVTAVSDLNLRVEAGQVFGFLGPNGAGKSTTIRMLMAVQRPTKGRATVLGLDVAADTVAAHRRTGYLPGDLELYPRLTGRQHIDWFGRSRGGVDDSFIRRLLDRFLVVADRPVRDLSKGNRQKIGLVLASCTGPSCLCSTSRPPALIP